MICPRRFAVERRRRSQTRKGVLTQFKDAHRRLQRRILQDRRCRTPVRMSAKGRIAGRRRNPAVAPITDLPGPGPERGSAVESRCGAVAVGWAYLFPPLSSGGASLVRPWLRFHTPLIGRVEDWRAGRPRHPDRVHVSSPLHVARSMRISRTARPHLLHAEAYGTYHAGATFRPSRRTR
jgi:hypothetical protein